MISSEIWNKQARVNFFQRLTKLHEPVEKFKVRLNSSRNCSVCVRITFDEMESSCIFVFNFGVGSLEQSVKPGRLVIFDFFGNSLL